MTVRAQTRVVNAPKPVPRWALERAALINKHRWLAIQAEEQRRRDVEATRRSAEANGMRRAQDEMITWEFNNSDFRGYFFRAAAEQLGAAVGRHVENWLSRDVDPVLLQRKKIADSVLSTLDLRAEVRTEGPRNEPVAVIRVDFPRAEQFNFAAMIGPPAW